MLSPPKNKQDYLRTKNIFTLTSRFLLSLFCFFILKNKIVHYLIVFYTPWLVPNVGKIDGKIDHKNSGAFFNQQVFQIMVPFNSTLLKDYLRCKQASYIFWNTIEVPKSDFCPKPTYKANQS